jgi:hypothetical protein
LLFLLRKKQKPNKNHFNLKIGKAFTKTQILTNSVEIVKKTFLWNFYILNFFNGLMDEGKMRPNKVYHFINLGGVGGQGARFRGPGARD